MPASLNVSASSSRTVLVVGAAGFLGGFVVAALKADGWTVRRAVRHPSSPQDVACDLMALRTAAAWRPLLDGVTAVINAAGILRETARQSFEGIHQEAPLALAQACASQNISSFVQISALGHPDDGPFIASKHRGDAALLQAMPTALVLRPSVVYSTQGSYGGTSLLRALAVFPGVLPVPGHGQWLIQPLAAEDLAQLVVAALRQPASGVLEVGGPEVWTLEAYQQRWREWLGVPGRRVVRVPKPLVSVQAHWGEAFGHGPLGTTMWRMLQRGNILAPGAYATIQTTLGYAPGNLDVALAARPSQVQDRWQAQLALLSGPLRLCLVALWLLSGWVGIATPASTLEAVAADSVLALADPVLWARTTGVLDLALAAWLLATSQPRVPLVLMGVSALAYTVGLGALLPGLWLDPLGGLAKNLVVLPALAVAWVLAERR